MHVINVDLQDICQALSDPSRIRIVRLLVTAKCSTCLCELVDSLQEPQYKLSRHVKTLRQAGLLTAKKEGRWVYHHLVLKPGYLEHLYALVMEYPDRDGTFAKDAKRFKKRLALREGGRCQIGIQTQSLVQASEVLLKLRR
jgi:ArsR family transcriptional regulator